MLYAGAFSMLISAGIGFAVRLFLQKFFKSGMLPLVSGGAMTLLLSYLIMSFFKFGFYSATMAGVALLVYALFLGLWNDRTGSITRRAGMTLSVLFVAALIYLSAISSQPGVDQTYLLPLGFKGCVLINYEVEGAPPLKVEDNDNEIVYHVPDGGIINTSSPMEFGWVSNENSGPLQLRAFFVDEVGNKVQELPRENILFGANGSIQEEGKPERTYYFQLFGSKEVETEGCPAVESSGESPW
ncbi:hypothetical protein AV656_11335 [Bhargavaea cecembensis]|uniref:DUF6843 domain-containing protein n=2 Tax=Bhargavaea cecembensis TaxID=394098 RepID=A0A163ETT4_9BACL|nr:hypothetical protein AV656_11335 [Bhargavaea cecembensis]